MLPILLLALFPRQDPLPSGQDRFEFGQLRHVQLLEPRGEVVRFATQIEIGTMERDHWPEGEDTCIAVFEGDSTQPVAGLVVGTSIIPYFTWTERPAWFLMELGKATLLAVVVREHPPGDSEDAETRLRLLSFPRGEELLSIAGVEEIGDGLVSAGRGDLLVRRGGNVLWLRSSETGEVVSIAKIELGLGDVACAAFVRGDFGEELRAWAVGWKGKDLFAVPFREGGAEAQRTFRLVFEGGSSNEALSVGEPLRAAAWASESKSHLAVSWPGYDNGIGRLQLLDVSATPRALWRGRPYPVLNGDTSDQRDYGQALAFVSDADEDGLPELLVTGPWNSLDSSIDILSGGTGSLMRRWKPPSPDGLASSTGHSLSLSSDSRRVLVGGAAFQAYPEDLTEEGQAHLLDVARMEKLQTWKLSPRER